MPFEDEFFEVYEMLKELFADNFEFSHAGEDINTQQNILKDIVQMIFDADVIIADLTNLNSNVFYELGIAHTLNKKVIAITKDIKKIPFDIKSYRAIEYSTHFKQFYNLTEELERYLKGAIDGTVVFGNPVTDFLYTVNPSIIKSIYNKVDNTDNTIGEDGIIDFIADIEEKVQRITETLYQMTDDLVTMTNGIENGSKEIERVRKNSGTVAASFVRKVTRKVAEDINVFVTKLKIYNSVYFDLWPQVEKSCISLLENEYSSSPENKEGMITFLKTLYEMKQSALTSAGQTESMLESFINSKGMERSLTQAINLLEIDVKQYLQFIYQMNASIERILDKSRFVVGPIEFSSEQDGETDGL